MQEKKTTNNTKSNELQKMQSATEFEQVDINELCEITHYDEQKEIRKQKRLEKKFATAQSTDGVDPLYNSEEVPEEIIKKIKNRDKQFKKEQRTKALNIINDNINTFTR